MNVLGMFWAVFAILGCFCNFWAVFAIWAVFHKENTQITVEQKSSTAIWVFLGPFYSKKARFSITAKHKLTNLPMKEAFESKNKGHQGCTKLNFWYFGDNGMFLRTFLEHLTPKWVFTQFLSKTRFLTYGQLYPKCFKL